MDRDDADGVTSGPLITSTGVRPLGPALAVDWLSFTGALMALVGFLSPWFKKGPDYEWWYSGWYYLQVGAAHGLPGGWTLPALLLFVVAAVAALWGARSASAGYSTAIAAVTAIVWSMAAVASAFGAMGARDTLDRVVLTPLGVGFPLLAVGTALLITGAMRTVAMHGRPASG
jgi:hypothetical protein